MIYISKNYQVVFIRKALIKFGIDSGRLYYSKMCYGTPKINPKAVQDTVKAEIFIDDLISFIWWKNISTKF